VAVLRQCISGVSLTVYIHIQPFSRNTWVSKLSPFPKELQGLLKWYCCRSIFPEALIPKGGLNAVLMQRQSCVEAYAEDAQAPASSFGSEKEGSLSKA